MKLFGAFDAHLKAQGRLAMGGQMIDASIVPVPKQRNPEAYLADILGRVRTHYRKHLDELLPDLRDLSARPRRRRLDPAC